MVVPGLVIAAQGFGAVLQIANRTELSQLWPCHFGLYLRARYLPLFEAFGRLLWLFPGGLRRLVEALGLRLVEASALVEQRFLRSACLQLHAITLPSVRAPLPLGSPAPLVRAEAGVSALPVAGWWTYGLAGDQPFGDRNHIHGGFRSGRAGENWCLIANGFAHAGIAADNACQWRRNL